MKTKHFILSAITLIITTFSFAQNTDDVLNLLIKRGLIKQSEADSLKAGRAIKQKNVNEDQELFPLNGNTPFRVGGYIQTRFQSFQQTTMPSEFDIRRARLIVDGNTSTWEYRLNADFASSPKLIDAYVGFKPYDFLKITVGQFYIPFSLENVTADRELSTIDRSQVVTALASRDKDVIGNQNGRDIGIQLSGNLLKINERYLVNYYLGLFNGSGINTVDNNQSKDISGRLVFHPFKIIDIGGSYYNGFDQWSSGTPAKLINQNRIRYGGEILLKYKAFSLQSEYIQGQDGNIVEINKTNTSLNRAGWYAQAGYFVFPKKLQIIAKYDTYDPNTLNNENLVKGSTTDATTYYVLGFNYFFNAWTKLQINYSYRVEQGTQIKNDVLSAQFQIIF